MFTISHGVSTRRRSFQPKRPGELEPVEFMAELRWSEEFDRLLAPVLRGQRASEVAADGERKHQLAEAGISSAGSGWRGPALPSSTALDV
jgi:hypothetical protein